MSSQSPQGQLILPDFRPGFIPGSLYIAISQKELTLPSSPKPVLVEFLGLFYLERPTLPPNDLKPLLTGNYWFFEPNLGIRRGEVPVQDALHNVDVVGYARVAEHVALNKLQAFIAQEDSQPKEGVSSEQYVFNILNRLRRFGVLFAEAAFWTIDKFTRVVGELRTKWKEEHKEVEMQEGLRRLAALREELVKETEAEKKSSKGKPTKEGTRKRPIVTFFPAPEPVSRPFTEFALCDPFSIQEHPRY
jgi:hypothetical protein